MRVLLTSAYQEPAPDFVPQWLMARGSPGQHELVEDASIADLIIFAETFASLDPYFLDVLRHPIFRKHRQKCVLYHYSDAVITFCRTVSPSVEQWQPNQGCRRSFHYIARRREALFEGAIQPDIPRKHLFSFQGDAANHPLRRRIMALQHPEGFLCDVSGRLLDGMSAQEREIFQAEYFRSILESEFVLCPRGLGPTSMRLFEVMQMGRVPVIIGDTWKPIDGIPWDECAVFVPEKEIERVPEQLAALRGCADIMGRKALAVWHEFFAPKRALPRLIHECAATLQTRYNAASSLRDISQLFSTRDWRGLCGSLLRVLRFGMASRVSSNN